MDFMDGFWHQLHKTWMDYWMGLQGAGPGVQEARRPEGQKAGAFRSVFFFETCISV